MKIFHSDAGICLIFSHFHHFVEEFLEKHQKNTLP